MRSIFYVGTEVEVSKTISTDGEHYVSSKVVAELNKAFKPCLRLRNVIAKYLAKSLVKNTVKKSQIPKWLNMESPGALVEGGLMQRRAPVIFEGEFARQIEGPFAVQLKHIGEAIDEAICVIQQVREFGQCVQYMGDEKLNVGGEIYSLRPLTPLVVQVLANQKDLSFFISDGSERSNFHVPNDVTEVRETPEKVGRIARVTGWFSESEWVVLEFNDMSNKLVSARCKIPDRMVEFFHEHGDRHFDVHLQILRTSYSVKGKRPAYYYILDAEVFRDRLSRDEFFGRMENGQSRWFVPFPKDKQAGLQQKLC